MRPACRSHAKAAALNSSYAGFPTRDLGFNLALAANAEHLAEVLHHLRDLSPSLEQADLARRLYEQATAADPDNAHWRNRPDDDVGADRQSALGPGPGR